MRTTKSERRRAVGRRPRGGLLVKVSGALLAGVLGAAAAAEEPAPDPELLEYLGSWEESDADWLLFADAAAEEEDEQRSEPVPEGEASPESQDGHEISH